MKVWVARDYQQAMYSFAMGHLTPAGKLRCNLYASPGSGKTSTALWLIDTLLLCGYVKRVLILAPKRVATDVWGQEIEEWANFRHLSYALAVGGKKERMAALAGNAQIVICNYDVLASLVNELGDAWPFDGVICDEVMKLKSLRVSLRTSTKGKAFVVGQGGKNSRTIAKVAHSRVNIWLGLTGSPAPNGLIDTWAPTWFIDAGQRLGRSFTSFQDRWFRQIRTDDDRIRLEPTGYAQGEIQTAIRDIAMTVEAKDFMDLPPLLESEYRIELSPKLMAKYKTLEEEAFLELESVGIEAFNSGALLGKLLQFCSGAIYDEHGDWHEVHDAKLEALRDCVDELNGAPLLVAYQFRHEYARIKRLYPKAVLINDDKDAVRKFQRGEIEMLIAHAASAGHGLNLAQNCWNMVDFSSGFNLEHDEQIIERIGPTRQVQGGYNRTVTRKRLICAHTIEGYVVKRLKSKASIQDMLKEAMKCR